MMDILSDSDWESSSESISSEDKEEIDFLYDGQAQNILLSLESSIGRIDDFLSFDKGFMYGDVVCSVTDPSGQMGRVVNVDMLVDLENVGGEIIKDVNSKRLSKIHSISVGDYVIRGSWLGRVDKVVESLTILFDDGRKCDVTATDQDKILPITPNLLEDSQCTFYPGQRVQVRTCAISNPARWLCGSTWKEYIHEGTISAVKPGLVYVDWLASALVGHDSSCPAPPRIENSKNLTLLSCFSHANWQLGDWCLLSVAYFEGGVEHMSDNRSTHGLIKEHTKVESEFLTRDLNSSIEEIFVIAKTKTKVDVLWQDGSKSLGLDSNSLCPINDINAHEFWPKQFVLEKGSYNDPDVSSSQRLGVVKGMDAKERTVRVNWKSISVNQENDFCGDWVEETMSSYELVEHPDYSYSFGDVVFRLIQNLHKAFGAEQNECVGKWYLSCIGNVIGFKEGTVKVRWASGVTTKVPPYEVCRLDKHESLTANALLNEENVEELNPKTLQPAEKESSNQKGKDLFGTNGGCKDQKHPWESSSSFFPQYTIRFFESMASSLFGSLGSTSLSSPISSGQTSEDAKGFQSPHEKEVPCDLCKEAQLSIVGELHESLSSASQSQEEFRQFDMVGDCSDHHFLDGPKNGLAPPQVKRSWLKKVQQEWSLLEKNLPETIYVRVCEGRMDLLRAAIVGCSGTPYHDGLFFFDIFLPPDYPYEPPLVHYRSGGLRVNPNLYESGKVCLSLLNTWTGNGTEVWNPGCSTVLQVLLSLQALVLNDKPYFNEAGYDKQMGRAEGEKNSVSYNENVFLVSCKSMLYLIRHPPKHFEALVEEHFSRHAKDILRACKAYMEGSPVGCAFGCQDTDQENPKRSSTGFKIMVAKLFPMLTEAFSSQGIDCSQLIVP